MKLIILNNQSARLRDIDNTGISVLHLMIKISSLQNKIHTFVR